MRDQVSHRACSIERVAVGSASRFWRRLVELFPDFAGMLRAWKLVFSGFLGYGLTQ